MIEENEGKVDEEDLSKLTNCSFKDFEFKFDDLVLAQMLHQEENNREFYDLETAQQIVDSQFDKSQNFFYNLFVFYLVTFITPLVVQSFIKN